MDTTKLEYIKWLRSQLKFGDQKRIAEELGYHHNHVRNVLGGTFPNDEIIRAAENIVYERVRVAIKASEPIFKARPDFKEFIYQSLAA